MKSVTFFDILIEKMKEPDTPRPRANTYTYLPDIDFTLFDLKPRYFKASYSQGLKLDINNPKAKEQKSEETQNKEIYFEKSKLNSETVSKWNLFEKTFQIDLGDKTTKSKIKSSFRLFLKKHHPDINRQTKTEINFATLVRIKDELLSALNQAQ